MKLTKENVTRVLHKIATPGIGTNLVESGALKNVQVCAVVESGWGLLIF